MTLYEAPSGAYNSVGDKEAGGICLGRRGTDVHVDAVSASYSQSVSQSASQPFYWGKPIFFSARFARRVSQLVS